jgi:NAD(P)H-dependent FMN reductase
LFGGLRVQLHLRDVLNGLDGRVLNKPEILIPEVNTKIDLGARELTGPTTRGLIGNQLRTFAAFIQQDLALVAGSLSHLDSG